MLQGSLREELDFNQIAVMYQADKSEENYRVLYLRTRGIVLKWIEKYIKDGDAQQDALTDTYIFIHDKIHMYDPTYAFMTWVYKLARNICLWEISRQKKITSIEEESTEDSDGGDVWSSKEYLQKSSYTPEYEFFEEQRPFDEQVGMLFGVMDDMPNRFRDLVIDRELSHLTMRELSDKHGVCENTVKTRLRHGREWLRHEFKTRHPRYERKLKNPFKSNEHSQEAVA